jgi:hypothetical protein
MWREEKHVVMRGAASPMYLSQESEFLYVQLVVSVVEES